MKPNRSALIGALLMLVAGGLAGAEAEKLVVEDWRKQAVQKRGIPDGWKGQSWGSPRYDFTVVSDGSSEVLHLQSDDDSSTITKEVKVDVKRYQMLEWRWKAVSLPERGDARHKETDDEAAQLYITFPRFPSTVRSRVIGYIWDTTAPEGAVFKSDQVGTVTFVVVRSGTADLGNWLTETRNVYEDYKRIYGRDPGERAGAVSISINSQNTRSRSESYFGEILFRQP